MRDWDLVLRGGRVIDPESGLDAVRDIAVAAARIAAIGAALPPALVDLDVAGQVLTSGFIDLHSHVSDLGGLRLQGMDGVTTALELEAGVTPVAEAYRRAAASRCSTRKRTPTGPATGTARGRRLGSGTSRSTAPSWCATARSRPTPGPGAPFGPTRAEPARTVGPGPVFERS